jgi:hypothetical protein
MRRGRWSPVRHREQLTRTGTAPGQKSGSTTTVGWPSAAQTGSSGAFLDWNKGLSDGLAPVRMPMKSIVENGAVTGETASTTSASPSIRTIVL